MAGVASPCPPQEKLQQAFHPDAQMYGAVGPDRYDEPIIDGRWQIVNRTFAHTGGELPPEE